MPNNITVVLQAKVCGNSPCVTGGVSCVHMGCLDSYKMGRMALQMYQLSAQAGFWGCCAGGALWGVGRIKDRLCKSSQGGEDWAYRLCKPRASHHLLDSAGMCDRGDQAVQSHHCCLSLGSVVFTAEAVAPISRDNNSRVQELQYSCVLWWCHLPSMGGSQLPAGCTSQEKLSLGHLYMEPACPKNVGVPPKEHKELSWDLHLHTVVLGSEIVLCIWGGIIRSNPAGQF